ncbi:hypothetical protein LWI29_035351 [Acer saccharum]|uniref:Uncharacterized protein n=1 Tax=Acer saccharum TaxID=4024 RepID=A0AA39SHD1_ACESA|nr:hypothetical protein LWI29_035351 [Acer saccharum]
MGKKPVLFNEKDDNGEGDADIGEEAQFDEEDGEANIRAEPIFDEEEEVQEELVDNVGAEPQFDEDEVVNEGGVEGDVGPLLMVRPVVITIIDDVKPEIDKEKCYSTPKFDKEVVLGRGDTAEVGRGDTAEVQGTTMVERFVCLTPHAAFATITNVDEQVEVPTELPFTEEEAQNNKSAAVEQGTAMVMRHRCLTPRADESDWLRNNVFHSTCTILGKLLLHHKPSSLLKKSSTQGTGQSNTPLFLAPPTPTTLPITPNNAASLFTTYPSLGNNFFNDPPPDPASPLSPPTSTTLRQSVSSCLTPQELNRSAVWIWWWFGVDLVVARKEETV